MSTFKPVYRYLLVSSLIAATLFFLARPGSGTIDSTALFKQPTQPPASSLWKKQSTIAKPAAGNPTPTGQSNEKSTTFS